MKLPAYQPRRPVPWKGFDVALLLIVFLVLPFWTLSVAKTWLHVSIAPPPADAPEETVHPLCRILTERQDGCGSWPLLVGILMAVVIAPIAEELIFRLLLQGWLESLARRLRTRLRWPRRFADTMPILVSAVIFSLVHYRSPMPRRELSTLICLLDIQALASVLTIAIVVAWLRFASKAGFDDFGFDFGKLRSDFQLGVFAAAVIIVPTYVLLAGVKVAFPSLQDNPWVDPVFLLPLAATLGFLYYRTHRITPSVALHMSFNAVATLIALTAGR